MSNYDDIPTLRHEPDYLADYGLQRPPFFTEHDDRFIYLDDERRQLLDMLQHLTRYSRLMLIVVGERGIGKTSIRQHFINQADERYLISDVAAHPMMDANELLSGVARGFGLLDIPATPVELQNNLYHYLAGLQQQDRTPVLLVDDAHELPRDALEALFYLADAEAGEGNLLHLVLFCEPAIEVMLESSAIQPLKERVTHHMRLAPFDEAQTAEYIRHRLAVAGLDGASPFTLRDIRAIYRSADGIPARINDAAYRLLVGIEIGEETDFELESAPLATRKRASGRGYLAAGGAMVLLVAAMLWWPESEIQPSVDSSHSPSISQGEPAAMSSSQEIVELRPERLSGTPFEAARDQHVPDDRELSVEPVGEPVAASTPALHIEAIKPNPVPASDELQTVSLHGKGFDESTRITVEWGNQRKTLAASRVALINDKQLDFRLRVGTRAQTWELLVRNPQSDERVRTRFTVEPGAAAENDPVPASAKAAVAVKETLDIDWLQRQPADHYTLQLLATRQRDNLQAFLQRHDLDTQSVIVESRKNSEPWYAAVFGSYPDTGVAREAAADLPGDLEAPWIRRIGDVQASLAHPADEPITDKPVPHSATLRAHTAWLWDQDPDAYTLQLIAGSNEPAIQDFIDHHALRGEAVFYQTRRKGNPWFVVVLGRHADRAAALAAREALPATLREQAPWPRAFADIHSELAAP
ncbi:SPOR domain-containing protein [Thiohalophilus sp.]|uniref:SPOR domain-containing protein n=1 Tax=Thiohalophilus sp. TaxID=3028392 RepID=UPI002ACD54D5|nr:SPOR domain-containing protein [Thiohalophilus sp.]MDZ7661613.1 SPOR domain-containing protein [Thiohalophilus sp.]MDZ7803584.1 SPOR domain-containing protein [Thiohalophilus sp.]